MGALGVRFIGELSLKKSRIAEDVRNFSKSQVRNCSLCTSTFSTPFTEFLF